MFADTLTIKGYGGVGDTTGTSATFNKINSVGKTCRYGLSTNTPDDSTFLDIKYQEGPRRVIKSNAAGDSGSGLTFSIKKVLVKITKSKFNSTYGRFVTSVVNLTMEYESDATTITSTHLKDLVAYASNHAGVTANFTKLLAQEA